MKKLLVTSLASLGVLLASASGRAHGDEAHGEAPHAAKARTGAPASPAAGGDHKKEHPRPHGGQVFIIDAADHMHAEALFEVGGLRLWFYDDQMKPLAPPAEAKATLVVGKEVRKLNLKPMATFGEKPDAHVGAVTALPMDGKLALVVQATVNGKPRSGRVERDPATTKVPPATATSTTTPTTTP